MGDFTFVSADYQSAGRGRTGRSWESVPGENLMFSILIKDKELVSKFGLLSVASAVAVMNAVKKLGVKGVSVKWPNDVYINGKKTCGILLEGVTIKGELKEVVIGIGLNVNQTEFGSVLHKATSLKLESGKDFKIKDVKKLVYKEIKTTFYSLKSSDYAIEEAIKNDYLKGKTVFSELCGEKKEVTVLGINRDGTLKVSFEEKEFDVMSGEITFHVE